MSRAQTLITENIATWTGAIQARSTSGRGSSNKYELYGIKKLRELILELAVRGKLVPQDPNDEPASVLLERIAAEKAELIKQGKIKKSKALPPIGDDEKPFELPEGWEWVRLGEVGSWATGNGFPKKEQGLENLEILFSKVSDMNLVGNEKLIKNTVNSVSLETAKRLKLNLHPAGTVIFPKIGGAIATNKRRVITTPTAIDNNCLGLSPEPCIGHEYLFLLLSSIDMTQYQVGTSVPALSQGTLEVITHGLPPLAEQQRIVQKVDELMALCDQLEQQTESGIEAHATLVDTLLATLTNSADADELQQNWGRIAGHFDTLFTTEQSIDALKQTILQLAVMGKLVRQNPEDEPASVLLERIAAEKDRLVKEKKIKKQKPLPEITDDEKPFELPEGWEWSRLTELVTLLGDGLHGTPVYTESERYYFVNGNNLMDGKIIIKPETKTVAQDQYDKYRKELNENTVLASINGTLGNVAFYNGEPIVLGKSACYFNLADGISKQYIKRIIDAPVFIKYAHSQSTGSTIKNLGLKAINHFPVALPPIEEQHRIVAKVDELMTLCDQLKDKLQQSQQTQVHLTDAIIEQTLGQGGGV